MQRQLPLLFLKEMLYNLEGESSGQSGLPNVLFGMHPFKYSDILMYLYVGKLNLYYKLNPIQTLIGSYTYL